MTIPTPTLFAVKPAAVRTVIDTRCGAEKTSGQRVYRCGRHGEHTRHIDCRANVAWTEQ